MPNDSYIIEIAIFTIQMDFIKDIVTIREHIFDVLKTFPGFISVQALSPVNESGLFADIVKWDTLEQAKEAAKVFESGDERFMPYMQAIKEVQFMGHFKH